VWVGRDDNKSAGLTGATGALPVWLSLMKQISTQPVNLIAPDNIKMMMIDNSSGLLASNECGNTRRYPYITGSEPHSTANCGNYYVPDMGTHTTFHDDFVIDNTPEHF
jgi:penicillin-binding protein 1B